ncbi:MAG: hypothetical protein HOF69_03920 [Campylobacteraceae bacterium]|nr:hypothetical protein [Campylobacteraceae bacterium]
MIKTKHSLITSIFVILFTYYIFLPLPKIINIILDEYIIILINILCIPILVYFTKKIKGFPIIEYIQNIDTLPIKSTFMFFILFQCVDFYYENGFIGMISLWFMYWVFALLIWQVTHIINFYKNYKFYKEIIK